MDARIDLTGVPVTTSAPVLVTGATGYVAGWIVKGLLDAGVTVHAAVRDPGNTRKVKHLIDAAAASPGTLKLFASDLLDEGSYAPAMDGCSVVIHTASPFVRTVDNPQRDLIDPAVEGTRNVLQTSTETPSVERVVLASSIAAMVGDAQDVETYPGHVVTEDSWNRTSSLTREPYSYSKVLAEREAWRLAEGQERWRLVTINPGLVIGPSLNAEPTSDSFTIVRQIVEGRMRFGAPRVGIAVVDVREIAYAHIAAAFRPEATGRHLVVSETTDVVDLARRLIPGYGSRYALPRRAIPKPVAFAVGPLAGLDRGYVRRNVGFDINADTTKSRHELGLRYRPAQESMADMFAQLTGSSSGSR